VFNNNVFTDINASIAAARETPAVDAVENAFKRLHNRRMVNPVLVFKYNPTSGTEESVYRL